MKSKSKTKGKSAGSKRTAPPKRQARKASASAVADTLTEERVEHAAQAPLPGVERPPEPAPDGPLEFRIYSVPGKTLEKDGKPRGTAWEMKARLTQPFAERHLEASALIGEHVRLRVEGGKHEESPKVVSVRTRLGKDDAIMVDVVLTGNAKSPQLLSKTVTIERVQDELPLGKAS